MTITWLDPNGSVAASQFCKAIANDALDTNYCSSISMISKYFKYAVKSAKLVTAQNGAVM